MRRFLGYQQAAIVTASVAVICGCTGGAPTALPHDGPPPVGPVRLTAFHGCGDELAGLRKAAEASVGPYGLPSVASSADGMSYPVANSVAVNGAMRDQAASGTSVAAPSAAAAPQAHSGTNDYVAGVDEPDLVKTDGRRIVTIANGVLQVIDAATRTVTGRLSLGSAGFYDSVNLLLSGDHALVFTNEATATSSDGTMLQPVYGPRLLLVNLAGQPKVVSSYVMGGALVDARQIGSTVRVVVSSQPRLSFATQSGASNSQLVTANRAIIAHAGLDAWLPEYVETSGNTTISGHVACSAVSRPSVYSGANLLTVLTFNLAADALGSGDGVSIAADGDTVYGTGPSLYIAGDERWLAEVPVASTAGGVAPVGDALSLPEPAAGQRTSIYRFDISGSGPPKFAAAGSVPGYLVDQYALSEWHGNLRVATTTGTSWALADGRPEGAQTSSSAVYELSAGGPVMKLVGHVAGLGVTERIYSVRFMGPVGYVVTFRQTDPLYTLDLSDPAHPRVRGSVALTGYSAYLYPPSSTRLIGIGRQADRMGHVGGTQVSLFDVSDIAAPTRLATFALAGAVSQAEFDPHAFLYWPASHTVVVPLEGSGALVLRVDDSGITQTGYINGSSIERSLVIGSTLWTISPAGAMASDLTSLHQQGWVPFVS